MRNHELLEQTRMPWKRPSKDDNQARSSSEAAAASSLQTPSTQQYATMSMPARDSRVTRTGTKQQQDGNRMSRAVHVRDIKIVGQHDKKPLIFTGGVAMPASRLVLVDCSNSRIIFLALTGSTAQTELALTSRPWGITMVNSTRLAVTCPNDQTITFVKVHNILQLDHKVKVKGECRGIGCINDRLVVSYCAPAKVELLSMSGKVLETVVTEDQGKHLFCSTWYIEASQDHASIYISDLGRNTVTRLSQAGQVLATYRDDKLGKWPRGMAVDKTGCVYVCGGRSNNVVQLAADLTQSQLLLQRSDGVKDPTSVCYCHSTDQLYVGMENSDVVKVFQLK